MQVYPSKQLSILIKHYLFIESNTKGVKKFRLFSDGNTGIAFSFKNKLVSSYTKSGLSGYLPHAFAYGQISSFKDIFCVDETSLLIIVFKPYALNYLLGIPANELIDQIIDLADLFGTLGLEMTDKLCLCKDINDTIRILESFLIKVCAVDNQHIYPMVIGSINFIQQNNGLINQTQLSNFTGYEQKQIERKFTQAIGITPKKYCNIIKLNLYLKRIRDSYQVKLGDLAYESGYYDQAHVHKDFKRITGVTPTQYSLHFEALALNLLEFPKPRS